MSLRLGDTIIAEPTSLDELKGIFYPVGAYVVGDNLVDEDTVKSVYGGESWEQITGALYGQGGDLNTVGIVSEQLPKLTASSTFSGNDLPNHQHTMAIYDNKASGIYHQIPGYGYYAYWKNYDSTSVSAGTPTGTVTTTVSGGPQVEGGHVLVKGTSTYIWKRTS